jgi:hypothetical protein
MNRRGSRIAILAAMLALRGCVNAALGVWMLTRRPGWTDVFDAGSIYAITDGIIGLLAVALIVSLTPGGLLRFLAAITCVDAIGRLAAGIALRAFPGIPHVPMTIVPFFAALGAGVAGLGVIGMTAWLVARAHSHRSWSKTADVLFDPLAAAALVSFGVGLVLFTDPPATVNMLRVVAASASGALALVFLTASFGAIALRRRS